MVATKTGFQKYPAYKDSGVEWLGNIPEDWTLGKLGTLLKPVSIKGHPDLPLLSITRELGVIERNLDEDEGNHNFIPDDLSGYKVIREGQFGMNKMKAWQGSYGISRFTGIVSPAYFIFDFTSEIDPRFFHFAIRSKNYVAFFGRASDGVRIGQWDLSKSRMKEIPFFIPSPFEQTAIANFLDEKTAKIDQAITQKEQLIALLKERKQIIIQNAVTKGLDPNVKLKDSGVEWIGEIPEHWEVFKFKQLFKEKKKTLNSELPAGAISYGVVKYKSENSILESTKESYQEVLKGEYLINPLNLNYDLVSLRIALSEIDVVVSSGYIVLKEIKELSKKYMRWLLHRFDISQMKLLGSGVRQTINFNHLSNELLILPPKKEQELIDTYIDEKLTQIDSSISSQFKQIEKLKEYKATLIDSAVTGKIKVS